MPPAADESALELPLSELHGALRRYWGYSDFRPLQEPIVRTLLAGRDACVVMPTGGGKSLCYQLPAAMRPGRTAVVISPLIALMQDQVAQLETIGIPAAALHSGVDAAAQGRILNRAAAGDFRLLYLSPERLARPATKAWLNKLPLSLFVIDEAHCISEWGHEFRPDYRQLSALREQFPGVPIAAFTASATRRVRHDILEQLQLRDPGKFIASFHRANLRFRVLACGNAATAGAYLDQALDWHTRESGASVIVYAPTIARVEQTAATLQARGLAATAYHGQMDAATRRENQERWMNDEAPVMVSTIAFGLGINKPSVRAVIHLALPKAIEQYYQEAGRAGRDGLPAEGILLWQKRDVGLLAHFIGQVEDPEERERAWQRYHEVRNFAEAPVCRHRQLCLHFGERPRWERCEACDVCGWRPEWETEPEVVPARGRRRKAAAATAAKPRHAAAPPPEPEPELHAFLRAWRRDTARAAGLPAYIVMHDRSLAELCGRRPRSLDQLLEVTGFGEKKVERYGPAILDALARFDAGERAPEN